MTAARTPEEAIALLARETRTRHGLAPHSLAGVPVEPGFRYIADGCFLLLTDS
jgi:hypothetical protein